MQGGSERAPADAAPAPGGPQKLPGDPAEASFAADALPIAVLVRREDLSAHLLTLGQRLAGLRSCLETLQDVIGVDGTLLWQQAFAHVMQV